GCLAWFTILAIGVRSLNLVLLPIAVLVPFLVRSRISSRMRLGSVVCGLTCGLITSGVLVTFGVNEYLYGHPLGRASMRAVHERELTPLQLYTHAARSVLLLTELPTASAAGERALLKEAGDDFLADLGADRPLPLEENPGWPGRFVFDVPAQAQRF